MRGKLSLFEPEIPDVGLIPAHAGKTVCQACSYCETWAHPRACGENIPLATHIDYRTGSSPRMRGKLPYYVGSDARMRLIPAHAGKTRTLVQQQAPCRAHPRACGENVPSGILASDQEGSSPRMRGKLFGFRGSFEGRGLIPAHAGKTDLSEGVGKMPRAHPRACGENAGLTDKSGRPLGSSPRMRGKLFRVSQATGVGRLIPAHAGKTPCVH